METFAQARPLADDPQFQARREKALSDLSGVLSKGSIDGPIVDIIERFARIPHCYTIQSCFGHFVSDACPDESNLRGVSDVPGIATFRYRIAYVAICVENSAHGQRLLEDLRRIADIDPDCIQFGSADWFWESCVNTYVLQVSPVRFSYQDSFDINREEAIHLERTRGQFYDKLRPILSENENIEGV